MAEQWYCQIAGHLIGPVSLEQLQAAADQGKILPTDRVRPGVDGDWTQADQVPGLFGDVMNFAADAGSSSKVQATSPTQPPSGGASATRPPSAVSGDSQPGAAVLHAGPSLAALLIERKRRQRRQMFFTGLIVFALSAALVAVLVWQAGGFTGFSTEIKQGGGLVGLAKEAKKHAGEPRESPGGAAAEPARGSNANKSADPGSASTVAKETKEAKEESPAEKDGRRWVDASMSRITIDQVPIKITAAAWQSRKLNTLEGAYFVIHVEVENPSPLPESRLTFEVGSLAAPRRWVPLTDDQGTEWPAREADPANTVANMLPLRLGPGKTGNDVLLFDAVNPRVKHLYLELSGEAFGREGTACFLIPGKMIRGLPTEEELAPPKPAKKKTSKPVKRVPVGPTGNPELDFGIRPGDAPPAPE